MKKRSEEEIMKLLSAHLDREVHNSAIRSRKEAFLSEAFRPDPFLGFQLSFLIPALFLVVLFFGMFSYVPPSVAPVYPENFRESVPQTVIKEEPSANIQSSEEVGHELAVRVNRVNSQVGPTMVFQSKRGNVPVTIVWVFAGG